MPALSPFPNQPALASHMHITTTITHSLVHLTSKGRSLLAIKIITSNTELIVGLGLRTGDHFSLDRNLLQQQLLRLLRAFKD